MHNIVRKVFAKLGILYWKQKWHYDIMILYYYFLVEQQSNDSLFSFQKKTGDLDTSRFLERLSDESSLNI